jgi:hypothetical protein
MLWLPRAAAGRPPEENAPDFAGAGLMAAGFGAGCV